ncbi:hypothetical protein THAOC_01878, partial [Thalassiosira oceanica]
SKDDVYEEVGLFPIRHYIEVRRQTVAAYIVNRPIFDRCVDAKRPRGRFWWEQPVDLNLARGGEQSSPGVATDDFSRGRRSGRRRVPVTLPEFYAYAALVGSGKAPQTPMATSSPITAQQVGSSEIRGNL